MLLPIARPPVGPARIDHVGSLGCKVPAMAARSSRSDAIPAAPDIDENGVDRAQIRAMLALSPEERLRMAEEFLESALKIRELNDAPPVR